MTLPRALGGLQARERSEATFGAALCLTSGACFACMAVFGKLAYAAGVGVVTLLALRFGGAVLVFGARRAARGGPRRARAQAVALGAGVYGAQATLFFTALTRIDVAIAALLLYTYPALVTVGGASTGHEPLTRRRMAALAATTAGACGVLLGGSGETLDWLGVALALGAAATYALYLLLSDRLLPYLEPSQLSLHVCVGAAASFWLAGIASGALSFDFELEGWLWVAAISVVSTSLAIGTLFAGMKRVGASTASILAMIEPPLTVALGAVVFGDRLTPTQVLGAVLVLCGLALVRLEGRAQPTSPS